MLGVISWKYADPTRHELFKKKKIPPKKGHIHTRSSKYPPWARHHPVFYPKDLKYLLDYVIEGWKGKNADRTLLNARLKVHMPYLYNAAMEDLTLPAKMMRKKIMRALQLWMKFAHETGWLRIRYGWIRILPVGMNMENYEKLLCGRKRTHGRKNLRLKIHAPLCSGREHF